MTHLDRIIPYPGPRMLRSCVLISSQGLNIAKPYDKRSQSVIFKQMTKPSPSRTDQSFDNAWPNELYKWTTIYATKRNWVRNC